MLFLTTSEPRAIAFLRLVNGLLDKQGRGNYYRRRRGLFDWFETAASAHARDPERALSEACWDDLALAGGGLALAQCLNKARAAYDAHQAQQHAEQRARETERERLRRSPDTLRAHLRGKHVRFHGHLDQFGAAGATALALLLSSEQPMRELELDAFAAIVHQLDQDLLEPTPMPVPPSWSETQAVERLADTYRRRQRAQLAELTNRFGEGPLLRIHRRDLDQGELLGPLTVERLEEHVRGDNDARQEQERLRSLAYLARREQEARERKHQLRPRRPARARAGGALSGTRPGAAAAVPRTATRSPIRPPSPVATRMAARWAGRQSAATSAAAPASPTGTPPGGRNRVRISRRRLDASRGSMASWTTRRRQEVSVIRVCLYLRISTDEDHQPTSLRTQRERLERYCEAMEDWRIVATYEDQASGTTLERPGLQQALQLARDHRIDLLLVYRVDRLSRKVRQLAALCEELAQLDVILKSATEPFDTGAAAGRMMLQMLGVFAEFEHATIVDRVTAGLERRVREGKWMSGRTPYGYTRDKETKLLVPDPVKAPVVRRIFHLYAEGKLGTTAIARTLDGEGAPPPRKQGWSPNALQLILANPAYRGLVRWNGETHPGLHEPIVDEATFEQAQEILRRRSDDASLRRGNPSDFLLSGLVRCHHCGRAYVGTSAHGRSGRYTYYACSTRYKYGPSRCNGDRLPKERLEAAVLAQLADLYRDGRVIENALADAARHIESEQPRTEEQLASTRAEIARLEAKLERYFEAFEDGNLSPADCQDRVRAHRARLETLRDQEGDLADRVGAQAHTRPDTAALGGLADQLDEILASESPEQAKELLRLLVKEIRVHDRRRIIPTYRIPAAVRAIPSKVDPAGLEPATFALPARRSPS